MPSKVVLGKGAWDRGGSDLIFAMTVSGNTAANGLSIIGAAGGRDLSWRMTMVGRALSLAAVMLAVGCFEAGPVQAQENLDAGKSPSQLFAGTCNACHKSPRGLLKTVAPGSLPGFLRQHYTTSPEMAGVLASYVMSNGASDTRYMGNQPKGKDGGKDGAKEAKSSDAKSDAKPDAKPDEAPSLVDQLDRFGRRLRQGRSAPEPTESREASPEPDGANPQSEPGRHAGRRHAKRGSAPAAASDARPGGEGEAAAQAPTERGADGRKSRGKQKLGRRGKPSADEPSKSDATRPSDAVKLDTPKSETTPVETARPAADDRPEPARIDAPKDSEPAPAMRADPATIAPAPATTQGISSSTGDSSGASAPSAMSTVAPSPVAPPPGPAVSPAGSPEPPISH